MASGSDKRIKQWFGGRPSDCCLSSVVIKVDYINRIVSRITNEVPSTDHMVYIDTMVR
jgi:hypothetical protein